jgi:hypothetical protein
MDFTLAVDRVRDDFNQMPGLELTVPQAVRLWNLGVDDCRSVVDALVDAGFLRWTPHWTIARTAREQPRGRGEMGRQHISVRTTRGRNKTVES